MYNKIAYHVRLLSDHYTEVEADVDAETESGCEVEPGMHEAEAESGAECEAEAGIEAKTEDVAWLLC